MEQKLSPGVQRYVDRANEFVARRAKFRAGVRRLKFDTIAVHGAYGQCGSQARRVQFQAFDAEELGKDRLFRFGLRMHPSPTAPRRVSEGLVRTHLSLSAHGDAARDVPVLASIAARRGALPFSARTPEPSSPARIQPQ